MFDFFIRWLVNTLTLIIVVDLVPGIYAESSSTVALAALVLGFLNAVLRPLFILFALPLLVYSLGIFIFFINGFLLYLVSRLIPSFHIQDFGSAVWGALAFSGISFVLNLFIDPRRRKEVRLRTGVSRKGRRGENVIDVEGKVKDDG